MVRHDSGFTWNGKHSYHDFGFTLKERTIGYPDKKKTTYQVPHSNYLRDFSSIYGFQTFEQREITYTINVADVHFDDLHQANIKEMLLSNWLMGISGQQRLEDDVFKGFYFMAEVEDGVDFKQIGLAGELKITFRAYPFKIDDRLEGSDEWDTFKFDFDVFQNTSASFNVTWSSFNEIAIGSFVHITDWATDFGGIGGEISPMLMGQSYQVTAMQPAVNSASTRQYQLFGVNGWVLEQDIVEAQAEVFEKTLYNPGTNAVAPEVIINGKNLTIQDDKGNYFNIVNQPTNSYSFKLYPGENNLKLYGQQGSYTVDFKFRKEML